MRDKPLWSLRMWDIERKALLLVGWVQGCDWTKAQPQVTVAAGIYPSGRTMSPEELWVRAALPDTGSFIPSIV